jgi:hypothetical protein
MSDDWKGGKNPLSFFVQVGGGLAAALVSSIVRARMSIITVTPMHQG